MFSTSPGTPRYELTRNYLAFVIGLTFRIIPSLSTHDTVLKLVMAGKCNCLIIRSHAGVEDL